MSITQFHIPRETFLFACQLCEQSDLSIRYNILRSFGKSATKLIELNAFNTSACSFVEDINDNIVDVIYKNDKPVYFDESNQKFIELSFEEISRYSLKFDWILNLISRDLNIKSKAHEIIKNSLWRIGELDQETPIFFSRRINHKSIFNKILEALERRKGSTKGIILTTSPFLPLGCRHIAGHKILSLQDCIKYSNNFHLDIDIIRAATKADLISSRKEGFSSGYRNAYFDGIEYKFTKKQAAIMEALDKNKGVMNKDELLAEADSDQYDLIGLFRNRKEKHPAWNVLIKNDGKGNYWLNH